MNGTAAKRCRSAAGAAWWTVLIYYAILVVSWGFALLILTAEPEWVRFLWGGDGLSWETIRSVYLVFFGTAKLLGLLLLTGAIWLTLWAGRLARQG